MKKLKILLLLILSAFFVLLGFTGCQLVEGIFGSSGTVNLKITDSPIDASNVKGVYITVNKIEYHLADSVEWIEMAGFTGPKTFNLLELTDGNSEMIGALKLHAGKVTQIRFILDAPQMGQSPSNPGCYIAFSDSTEKPLFVPSGSETGFKFTGSFDVPENGSVDITVDFDVRKSVVAKPDGSYILKPTTMHRIVVDNQAGYITGNVLNYSGTGNIIVYAYEHGSWKDTEDDTPFTDEDTRFPNAVTSAKAKTDDTRSLKYKFSYLAEGVYDLVVVENDSDGDYVKTKGFLNDVVVSSSKTTDQDIDLNNLATSLP